MPTPSTRFEWRQPIKLADLVIFANLLRHYHFSGFSQVCKIRTLASSPHIPNLTAKLEYNIPVVRQHALLRWDKPSDQGAEIRYNRAWTVKLLEKILSDPSLKSILVGTKLNAVLLKVIRSSMNRRPRQNSEFLISPHQQTIDFEFKLPMTVARPHLQVNI